MTAQDVELKRLVDFVFSWLYRTDGFGALRVFVGYDEGGTVPA
jgi:hypothetical protein